MPPWWSASFSDLYESPSATYLPTIAIFTSPAGFFQRLTIRSHFVRSRSEWGSER